MIDYYTICVRTRLRWGMLVFLTSIMLYAKSYMLINARIMLKIMLYAPNYAHFTHF